jgi:hypothetical protein
MRSAIDGPPSSLNADGFTHPKKPTSHRSWRVIIIRSKGDISAPDPRAALSHGGQAMFEVGESYRFKMWRPGKDGGEIIEHPHCMVISVEHPLIKIRGFDGEQIINTACIALRERSLTNGRRTSSFTKSKTMRGFCWGVGEACSLKIFPNLLHQKCWRTHIFSLA